jgi:cardiolipin synthase
MDLFRWAVEHHVQAVLVDLLVLWFAASVLRQRRPTGSAFGWLLAIILVPYIGIPCYLIFGGRKFHHKAETKATLPTSAGQPEPERHGLLGLGHMGSAASLEWLDDGVHAYQTFIDQINKAKTAIRIVTYVVGNDETGLGIVEALTRRAKDGIEVRLLLDDLLAYKSPHKALIELKAAGGRVKRFMPLLHIPFRGQANLRNHRKIAVFDGARAIVGGMNLASEYMGPTPRPDRWRDLSVLISGQVVTTLDSIFREDWEFASKEKLKPLPPAPDGGAVPTLVVPSGPDSASDPIYDALLTMLFRAHRRFWVATPYFVPDESLARALVIAARRGVEVVVTVPQRSNHAVADLVAGPFLRDLAAVGVKIRRTPGMVHAKVVLVDDAIATVGSANFDMRSLFLDYEVALFLTDPGEISHIAQWFEATFKDCPEGPPTTGPIRAAVESVARLLAPLI